MYFNNPELRTTLALNHNNPSHLNNKKEERKRGFSLAITSYEQRRTDARAHRVSHTVREKKRKKKGKERKKKIPRLRQSSNYPRLIKMHAFGRD